MGERKLSECEIEVRETSLLQLLTKEPAGLAYIRRHNH